MTATLLRIARPAGALAALVLVAGAGCAFGGGVQMTPQIIQQSGTHAFSAPYDKVFVATVGALKSEGFPIAVSQPDTGLIKTGQKLIRTVAHGGGGSAVAVDVTRQYVVRVTKAEGGAVVTAEPRIFQGNAELTDGAIWDIDSPEGERALWRRLFRDVQDAL